MRSERDMIAYALECTPSLLPHMPELLADLAELGSDADQIVETLAAARLPPATRVIDLGCGKGATAVEIATELGFAVLGIDLFEPFIESCRESAREAGVADLCEFRQGDILKTAGTLQPADVVIFAALGDVLGPLDTTMGVIRQFAKPGGLMLVSDAFVKADGSASFPGFETYTDHEETLRRLTAHGDVITREVLEDQEADEDEELDDETELIRRRAEALAAQYPELATDLMGFVAGQRDEVGFIEANLQSAVWVIRRG